MKRRWDDEWPRSEMLKFPPLVMMPGSTITGRTRWGGLRTLRVRLVGVSSRGRPFIIGHDRHGICHRLSTDNIIHVEPPRRR